MNAPKKTKALTALRCEFERVTGKRPYWGKTEAELRKWKEEQGKDVVADVAVESAVRAPKPSKKARVPNAEGCPELARMRADVKKYEEEETMDKTQQMLQKIDRIAQLQN
eukprot:SAG22_NODE_9314_length_596_cov_49.696177_3_plen_109_part_01